MLKWLVFEIRDGRWSDLRAAFKFEAEARQYMDRKNSIYKTSGFDVTFVLQKAEQDILVPDIWEGLEDGKED